MKNLIILILFLLSCSSPTKSATTKTSIGGGFYVVKDTITCDIKGKMTHALKFHDKYYVLFEEIAKSNYGGYQTRWLCIVSQGKVEKKVDLPKKLEVNYLDFFVHNDSIILKPYMDERIYTFDTRNDSWTEIKKADDLIFEDEKYCVYSLDFGEWGGKTWFKDKHTGFEYELEATTPLVNKIDTTYYLTNSSTLLKIKNPLLLNKCEREITYKNIQKNGEYTYRYGKPIGYQELYRDSTNDYFTVSYNPRLVTSFVSKNKLLHLYETESATYIAEIENNTVKPIRKVEENLRFYNWKYSYRCRNQNGNNELLKFETKNTELTGMIDIVDSTIYMHYFVNKAELYPKSVGTANANKLFIERLNYILSDFRNLKLPNVEQQEKQWKSYDNTPTHLVGIGACWNPKKYTIDTFKSFLTQEDSFISYTTEYFGSKSNDLVRAVIVEWNESTELKFQSEDASKHTFPEKMNFLKNYLDQKAGKPIKQGNKTNYTKEIRKTQDGLTIELETMKNFNCIRLVIFQH